MKADRALPPLGDLVKRIPTSDDDLDDEEAPTDRRRRRPDYVDDDGIARLWSDCL